MPYVCQITKAQTDIMSTLAKAVNQLHYSYEDMEQKLRRAKECEDQATGYKIAATTLQNEILKVEKMVLDERQKLFDSLKESISPAQETLNLQAPTSIELGREE